MNMIDFKGKRVLIRSNTADKGKDKEVIIVVTLKLIISFHLPTN